MNLYLYHTAGADSCQLENGRLFCKQQQCPGRRENICRGEQKGALFLWKRTVQHILQGNSAQVVLHQPVQPLP